MTLCRLQLQSRGWLALHRHAHSLPGVFSAGAKGCMPVPGACAQISVSADVCMEALVDKLKLLDYEKEFCRKK